MAKTSGATTFGPNWFASVMGTGIVATAAVTLPVQLPGQRAFALGVWVVAALLLLMLLTATGAHWRRSPCQARSYLDHPVLSHFYGAPPMALLTVGAGTLLLGRDLIGLRAAVVVDVVLWTVGTVSGLVCAVGVPYVALTRQRYSATSAFGGWLMPVVPPMVSATTGGLLVPYLPPGELREWLFWACYAMFGLSLAASLWVIALIGKRLWRNGVGDAVAVPTLWIVLGPLGQSITAAAVLGQVAPSVVPQPYADRAASFGVLYGGVTCALAVLWLLLAATVTVRIARRHLPFSLTWWSFTFPVGTLVTGSSALAAHIGLAAIGWLAAGLYAFLLLAWVVVAARTLHGATRGSLLLDVLPRSSRSAHPAVHRAGGTGRSISVPTMWLK